MSELPSRVQDKILRLKDAEQQALSIQNMTARQINELERLQGNNPEGEKAQSTGRELARLHGLLPDYQANYKAIANLNAKVARYLSLLPAKAQITYCSVKAKLKDGETHLKAVTRLRGEIMNLIGVQSRVERSVPTNKEAKASAKEFVASLARRIEPRLIVEHDKFNVQFGRGVIGEREPTPTEILAWVEPSLLLKRLEAMIEERQPANQMTIVDRRARLAEIKVELLELERREQAHIDAAHAEGTTIEQRPNCDVRALLGFAISTEKANAA